MKNEKQRRIKRESKKKLKTEGIQEGRNTTRDEAKNIYENNNNKNNVNVKCEKKKL